MWKSRQTAVRQVSGIPLASARDAVRAEGFEEHATRDDRILMKRPGTNFTLSAQKFPLKLALVDEGPGGNLELRLRYDAFVLFDSGDLEDEADRIVEVVGAAPSA